MYVGIAICGYVLYCGATGKLIIPGVGGKKKEVIVKRNFDTATKEIKGDFNDLLGVKTVHGNLFELNSDKKDIRIFVGAVLCQPINYPLRSNEEKIETDMAYEHLWASLSLGPGREVKVATHIHSRPIELVDQMKLYYDNFNNLDAIAQRYAQGMFFPFMEQWQKSVEEYDHGRYFMVILILEYTSKMIGDMDEESILIKARNEFGRLSSTIIGNYSRMGGHSEVCQQRDLYEGLYFATHKRTASIEHFRKMIDQDNPLSPFVVTDYRRDAYRYLDEEEGPVENEAKIAV